MKNYWIRIVACLFLMAPLFVAAQSVVRGFVYEDVNQNNRKDRREQGVSGVAVSNGLEVVQTNAEGAYELPASDDQIIFVIKPAGYQLPVNEFNLPQFYTIHKPEGSPDLKYKGSEPTGKLPRSVDFALLPSEEKTDFQMLVFGDPQPYTQQEIDFFAQGIVSELEQVQGVDLGLSLGDLVGDDLNLFDPYKRAVAAIGIPWFNVMGNHDMNYDGEADHLTDETFETHFGPANYAFNHGQVHFIVLDDILYPDPRDSRGYWGGFREDQLRFVENDLQFVPKDHLVVLAFHIPISEPDGDAFRDEDRNRLFELLKDYPHTLSMSAHTHLQRQDFMTAEHGWLQEQPHYHYNAGTTSGDWYSGRLNEQGVPISTMRDGTPKGYALLSFSGNEYKLRYQVAGQSPDYQFEIFAPKVLEQNKRTSAGIVVNFFMGSERDTVYCRIDDGEWKRMSYMNDYDPAYLHLLHEWDFTEELLDGRRPSNPKASTHLWRTGIPNNLDVGDHTIEVKVTDQFGQTFTQSSSYRIEAP
ncbi:calcineurin-like phosphoesterase C-terminal domain-containing protein [Sunxiuqinia dokdonensis]|uniref:Metallophosphoesterase n=1 Tax=Sunxiuqinia dokdonensis TaxID=1409788 RepID=A0A0L8V6M8_9BACT|nr:calcineurin-like phosphoesterase family protein [Sunxiuqinia dokdonensis]KOH44096.1 metallophosphoesterase [Sunxiuqinia dokdonensis]